MRLLATAARSFLMVLVLIVTGSHAGRSAEKIVFGWVTFADTKWPAPYSGGTIPHDSLPWNVLTHVGLFAANGQVPPQSSYINQYGAFTARAHAAGVYAGITVGGSGDAALVSMVGGGQASWLAWINHYLAYVDAHRMDFLDFDFEGSYSAANIAGFFSLLYDSLNVPHRYSGLDPSRKPFIVLTAGVSHAISWSSSAIRDRVEFVNLMTYDYNNSAWGRVTFDNSPMSYKYYNGTGGATDSVGTGVNAIAPSMQRMAIRVNAAGWPMNKLNVGMDFNGGGWGGATRIRQGLSGTSSGGSNLTFSSSSGGWGIWKDLPADSIFFDQVAKAYWARSNGGIYTWLALPGRDSGVIATRMVVDSMGLGGVCIWNLGNEIWNASSIPPGGRGWFFSQLRRHFNYGGTQPPPPPADTTPPSINLVRPLNGDTLSGTVLLEATASDNVGVASVRFLLDGAALGSPDASPPYTYSWNTDPVPDGSHTVSAIARDLAGLETRRDVTVWLTSPPPPPPDTIPPTVAFVRPLAGDSLTGTVTVEATASDNAGLNHVRFLLDGAALGSQDNSAPFTVAWNTDAASDGPHTLSAIARDNAGLETRSDIVVVLVSPPPPPPDTLPPGSTEIPVATDGLAAPWVNGSWGSTISFASTERAYSGASSVKAVQSAWGGVSLHSGSWSNPVPVAVTGNDELRLAVHPETLVTLRVELANDLGETFGYAMLNQVPPGRWSTFTIPVSTLNPENRVIHQVTVQNYVNRSVTYFLDDLKFVAAGSGGVPPAGLGAAVLLAPADNATDVAAGPALSWQAVAGATSYHLQVSPDPSFTVLAVNAAGVTGTATALSPLEAGVLYHWRVRGVAGADTGAFSPAFRFTTAAVTSTLKYDRLFVEFGDVGIGDTKTDSVVVTNDNDYTVTVSEVRTTSSRFTATLPQTSIGPKASRKLYLSFKPDRRATETDVVISISGSVTRLDTVRLRGTGAKKSRGRFSRGAIVARPADTETAVNDSFYVSNDGDLPLALSSVTTTNADIEVTPSSAVIPPADSLLFRLQITMGKKGKVKGYVVITPENGQPDSVSVDVTVAGTAGGAEPETYALAANYPNPFNPETRIGYTLPGESYVRLVIYSVHGQEVAVLRDGIESAGLHEAVWNGRNEWGGVLPSGVYFYRIEARGTSGEGSPGFVETRSMLLVK